MAIGAKQRPLHELTTLMGAQPAEYRGEHWSDETARGSGLKRIRADRLAVGQHPCGVAPLDAVKIAAGYTCGNCKFSTTRAVDGAMLNIFYRCILAGQRADRRKTYGGKRAFQVRIHEPACVLHEYDGIGVVKKPGG